MAIKSTIFKLQLNIADNERGYYEEHSLTLARHPSETNQRFILRIAVFAVNAHEYLQFTKGLSDMDEPDLWQKSLTGDIEHWIEIGQPQEKRIRQACSKAARVSIYTYQRGAAQNWYEGMKSSLERFDHLRVVQLQSMDDSALDRLVERSMTLSCLIDDQQILISSDGDNVAIGMNVLKP